MPTHRFVTLALLGLLSTAAAPVAGDERSAWPQWRGPARDGHAWAFEASSPQGYQSTGLCRCNRRYGLLSRASRLVEPEDRVIRRL